MDRDLQEQLIDVANEMADAARAAILPHFRTTGLVAENKYADGGFDPVTVADRAAEAAMRAVLARRRPDDAILGEELGESTGKSGLKWVLDPIDGTRGFITGTPTWGVLIALGGNSASGTADTGPKLGLIDQPYIAERFLGGFGQAWMEGPLGRRPLATSRVTALSQATLFSTFPELGSPDERRAFDTLSARVRLTRFGMDCYAYALLAAGHVDLVVEAGLQPHDIQAPIALIQAAGGVVTNWQGGPAHAGGRALAAANPTLHKAALEVLSQSV